MTPRAIAVRDSAKKALQQAIEALDRAKTAEDVDYVLDVISKLPLLIASANELKLLLYEGRSLKQALAIAFKEQRMASAEALKRRKAARSHR